MREVWIWHLESPFSSSLSAIFRLFLGFLFVRQAFFIGFLFALAGISFSLLDEL